MTNLKNEAFELLGKLHSENRLTYQEYNTLFDGLDDIETLKDRDKKLEDLWERFADVPINPETGNIEDDFAGWKSGTNREEIWHWFDERHSKGIVYLLLEYNIDRTDKDEDD